MAIFMKGDYPNDKIMIHNSEGGSGKTTCLNAFSKCLGDITGNVTFGKEMRVLNEGGFSG